MNNEERMNAGIWYDANYDAGLQEKRSHAMHLIWQLNQTDPADTNAYTKAIESLLGKVPEGLGLLTPFYCDYGYNIKLGSDVFINLNCYMMDGAMITIGNNVFIGPYCGFYTANHPLQYAYRNKGYEKASPITIGDNCWFGANCCVMPGVTICSGCVIAAGSVVTKDMPANSMVMGVPAKAVHKINQDDIPEGMDISEI